MNFGIQIENSRKYLDNSCGILNTGHGENAAWKHVMGRIAQFPKPSIDHL